MDLLGKKKNQQDFSRYLAENGQVSLIITFTVMFLLLASAFYLTNTSVKNLQAANYIGMSSKSFYAAESGVEIFVFEKFKGTPPFVLDPYVAGDVLACGCVANNGTIKTVIANGASAVCSAGAGATDCNQQNMHFNVEKITGAENNKIKSTGGYQNTERAVRMQW